jgi:hypothetical protein
MPQYGPDTCFDWRSLDSVGYECCAPRSLLIGHESPLFAPGLARWNGRSTQDGLEECPGRSVSLVDPTRVAVRPLVERPRTEDKSGKGHRDNAPVHAARTDAWPHFARYGKHVEEGPTVVCLTAH